MDKTKYTPSKMSTPTTPYVPLLGKGNSFPLKKDPQKNRPEELGPHLECKELLLTMCGRIPSEEKESAD